MEPIKYNYECTTYTRFDTWLNYMRSRQNHMHNPLSQLKHVVIVYVSMYLYGNIDVKWYTECIRTRKARAKYITVVENGKKTFLKRCMR